MSLWQGKRQEARGKSEEGLGDFTFLYTVWFYCVHLLTSTFNERDGEILQESPAWVYLYSKCLFP
ncbi:MAG: hypothetical protein HEQ20_18575 [Aphanizomenon flos-aquae KM1D3_PB]|uniref:hypothetical protein n=1 Tax=Aphanizomenon flos-aquae TaxID=1176 RepID=UPI001269B829|nr:hypothetical protein [Aphanizomenon flos-aquae]QSV72385.1 MAG: hypothetical protein HEQ20_18575 [Aphanizomenon flos-aquae KM1D3_PB]